jgi:hypothetical protein
LSYRIGYINKNGKIDWFSEKEEFSDVNSPQITYLPNSELLEVYQEGPLRKIKYRIGKINIDRISWYGGPKDLDESQEGHQCVTTVPYCNAILEVNDTNFGKSFTFNQGKINSLDH